MSTESFITAVSDLTNLNSDESATETKGRFKVIHIEDTDESNRFVSLFYFTKKFSFS